MRHLLDTGILLRLLNRQADAHESIRGAVRHLKLQGHECITSLQNVCEFWNVCTRPQTARGGLGLTFEETGRRLRAIERIAVILPDSPNTYPRWKQLAEEHQVQGVQVHDARLVALMDVHGVRHLLTLNPTDFVRYRHVVAQTPEQVLVSQS
jgi:predicted nucleic acid-binding protein